MTAKKPKKKPTKKPVAKAVPHPRRRDDFIKPDPASYDRKVFD